MTPEQQAELLIRIDERTRATHEMLKKHLADDEKVHDQLFTKVNRNTRWVNTFLGAIGAGGAGAGGWQIWDIFK